MRNPNARSDAPPAGPASERAWSAPTIGFAYAFQPIVDTVARQVVSYEALIRGAKGEPAWQVLEGVAADELHRFDAASRVVAVEQASQLGVRCNLNVNFLPQGLFRSADSIESTIAAARRCGLALEQIVIEVTESEVIDDHARFAELINVYRAQGIKVAIDDFGAGYSGLNLLSEFQPDQLKVDMALVRGIAGKGPRQAIVRAIVGVGRDLGIDVVAEGVETLDELRWFEGEGVRLFQGYLFAKPGFGCLPAAVFPR